MRPGLYLIFTSSYDLCSGIVAECLFGHRRGKKPDERLFRLAGGTALRRCIVEIDLINSMTSISFPTCRNRKDVCCHENCPMMASGLRFNTKS